MDTNESKWDGNLKTNISQRDMHYVASTLLCHVF